MANKGNGTKFVLYIGATPGSGTLVAHAITNSINLVASIVDVTDKSSGNNREILSGEGIKSGTISISGIYSDDAALATMRSNYDNQTVDDYYMEYGIMDSSNTTNATDAFKAKITNLTPSGENGQEMTFSATLESSGSITYTAES
tara:strand:+ start:304 stop:738 length:435 start_codon:yes stop_codon:yes gene_type:complete